MNLWKNLDECTQIETLIEKGMKLKKAELVELNIILYNKLCNSISEINKLETQLISKQIPHNARGAGRKSKLDIDDYNKLMKLRGEGWSLTELAVQFGVSRTTISLIINNKLTIK